VVVLAVTAMWASECTWIGNFPFELSVICPHDEYRMVPEQEVGHYLQHPKAVVYLIFRCPLPERADEVDSFEREEYAGGVPSMCVLGVKNASPVSRILRNLYRVVTGTFRHS